MYDVKLNNSAAGVRIAPQNGRLSICNTRPEGCVSLIAYQFMTQDSNNVAGGVGTCRYCGFTGSNVAFHETVCPSAHPGARKITPEDPPQFPCEMCGTRDDGQPLTRWHTIPSKEWMDIGTKLAVEWHSWRPLSAPRPEGPPEGEALALEDDGPAIDLSQRLTASDQPAATEPRDIYHQTGRSMLETGNALLAKDAAATEPPEVQKCGCGDSTIPGLHRKQGTCLRIVKTDGEAQPPATGATPETDAAWEAAPPADHGGMTAMRRCSESLETRLQAAEAEVRRLKEENQQLTDANASLADVLDEFKIDSEGDSERTASEVLTSLRAQLAAEKSRADDLKAFNGSLSEVLKEKDAYSTRLHECIRLRDADIATLRAKLALADGLANEAQILVNIIKTNTQKGMCVLVRDMTIGTTAALTAYRAASVPPAAQAFSPELLTHCLIDDAARQIFKTEARKHVTRDEHSGMVLTVYLHPDGRILVDDISPAATGTKGVAS